MHNYGYGCGPRNWREGYFSSQVPVNVSEDEKEFKIEVHAPGLVKDNFSITTQSDILNIRYRGDEHTKNNFIRREYRAEEIQRSFDLKGKINTDAISAKYSDGILTVELPKI